ncbi:hypothetical protein XELAEV_18030809mg [Xenopus laevis]|uniref:Uncharacterized protein n=1 Tax=Xenopus laevis TaxID=8355 RepID=A0A974CLE7_XENLA|nr:hypothetical protein XELAEV_18030809mg [Xenopus laevis]
MVGHVEFSHLTIALCGGGTNHIGCTVLKRNQYALAIHLCVWVVWAVIHMCLLCIVKGEGLPWNSNAFRRNVLCAQYATVQYALIMLLFKGEERWNQGF